MTKSDLQAKLLSACAGGMSALRTNRFEEALLRRIDAGEIQIPLLYVDIPGHERLTSLSVPHRVHDAIFRDCRYQGKRFRESDLGKEIAAARAWNATAMYRICPTALLFGTWDSQPAVSLYFSSRRFLSATYKSRPH